MGIMQDLVRFEKNTLVSIENTMYPGIAKTPKTTFFRPILGLDMGHKDPKSS